MKHALDLWSWQGRVTRLQYLAAGATLFCIKYGLDVLVSTLFHRGWNPLMYLSPRVSPLLHPSEAPAYWIALAVVALPFVAAGVSLSARRLRDMGIDPFWAGLFFLPFLHFVFFVILGAAPSAREPERQAPDEGSPFRTNAGPAIRYSPPGMQIIPRGPVTSLLFGVLLSLVLGLSCFVMTVQWNRVLGSGLFVAVPFGMGFLTAFCVSSVRELRLRTVMFYSWIPIAASLVALIAVGWEGVACLVMALPILLGMVSFGAVIGWLTARSNQRQVGQVGGLASFLMMPLVPALVGGEVAHPPAPEPMAVVSTVTIHAPPDVVWKNVVAFPPIDEPPEPIFAICAMPIEARIDGHDPGATRHCIFTNGEFEEPVEVWNEPHELTFGVSKQPERIEHYIDVKRGQFLLIANTDGTTTLRGTTWYDLRVHPAMYWKRWTQLFLHAIHMRALTHIQHLSEHPEQASGKAAQLPPWMLATNATCRCTMHAQGR